MLRCNLLLRGKPYRTFLAISTCRTSSFFLSGSSCLDGQMSYQCSVENDKEGSYRAKLKTATLWFPAASPATNRSVSSSNRSTMVRPIRQRASSAICCRRSPWILSTLSCTCPSNTMHALRRHATALLASLVKGKKRIVTHRVTNDD